MFDLVLQGALVSGGLIIAIGAQNAFVLRQGLLNQNMFYVCLVCFLCDTILIGLGVLGVGTLLQNAQWLLLTLALAGAVFLYAYGATAFIRAFKGNSHLHLEKSQIEVSSSSKLVLTTLAITLLNPHVYLDTLVIIGGIGGTLALEERYWFLLGAVFASFLWFFGLGYGSKKLIPLFANSKTWRVLDSIIGLVMCWIATGLAIFVYQNYG